MPYLDKNPGMPRAVALMGVVVVGVAAILGSTEGSLPQFTEPSIPDTADYTIDSVTIVPPPAGQPGQGTVAVVVHFTLHANTGNVSPMVWVYEHDAFQNSPPDLGSSGDLGHANPFEGAGSLSLGSANVLRTTFTFTCGGADGNEVLGPNGRGTGEGDWDSFPPQVQWDDAEIRGVAARQGPGGDNTGLEGERQSPEIDMSCAKVADNPDQYLIQHSPS